jgi:hypothetical protein
MRIKRPPFTITWKNSLAVPLHIVDISATLSNSLRSYKCQCPPVTSLPWGEHDSSLGLAEGHFQVGRTPSEGTGDSMEAKRLAAIVQVLVGLCERSSKHSERKFVFALLDEQRRYLPSNFGFPRIGVHCVLSNRVCFCHIPLGSKRKIRYLRGL